MSSLDDHIAEHLQHAEASGELRGAPSWGKPLAGDDGFEQTPEALRMPYKILKDAGLVPPEVELFQQLSRLKEELSACADAAQHADLAAAIGQLQQLIGLRLEALRIHATH